jgi:ArsR family transcriptional regulator
MTEDFIKQTAALSDKARVDILREIAKRGVVTCSEAVEITQLAQPTVSHHIKILVESGLVESKKIGRHIELRINRKAYKDFLKEVSSLVV